jgi:Flp pilus assembly protein TadG
MSRFRTLSIRTDVRGTTALEMALILPVLLSMLLGGMELGLMMWTKNTLQSVAATTARCVAISSSACSASPATYAVGLATSWLGSAMIVASNVVVTTVTGTKCGGVSGVVVTITASPWSSSIIYPIKAITRTTTSCYPT